MKNIFYFKRVNSIGGVEQFLWYLSKKYDFEFYYKEADAEQIKRLAQNIEVHKYQEPIICDNFFCNYGLDIQVEAKEKYFIIHCDYKKINLKPIVYDGFKNIGVSQLVCDSYKELTGKETELIYNPIYIKKTKEKKYNDKKIHLISATRLTKEKGFDRIKKLAYLLDEAEIEYIWEIYTNKHKQEISKNVIYKEPKLDLIEEIAKVDYLVQLSDCEAYCYSIVEALSVGTKVICTDLPVLKEIGVNKDDAIIYNFDMSNVDVNEIKKYKSFEYTPPKDNWDKYLSTKKIYNKDELVEVEILKRYTDVFLNKQMIRGAIEKMPKHRASYLEAKGLVKW